MSKSGLCTPFSVIYPLSVLVEVQSVQKAGDEDDEIDAVTPILIGCVSPKFLAEKEKAGGVNLVVRGKTPTGFFGVSEGGNIFVNGHKMDSAFGGFQNGNTVTESARTHSYYFSKQLHTAQKHVHCGF